MRRPFLIPPSTVNRPPITADSGSFGKLSRLTTIRARRTLATRSGARSIPGRDGLRWDAIRRQLGGNSTLAEIVVRSLDTTDSLSVQEHLSRDRTTRVREVDQATYAVAPNQSIESRQRMKPRNVRRADIAGLLLCRWSRSNQRQAEEALAGARAKLIWSRARCSRALPSLAPGQTLNPNALRSALSSLRPALRPVSSHA